MKQKQDKSHALMHSRRFSQFNDVDHGYSLYLAFSLHVDVFKILRNNFKNPGRLHAPSLNCIGWAMNLRGRRYDPVGLLFNLTGPSGGPW